jgi:hypothetical protein
VNLKHRIEIVPFQIASLLLGELAPRLELGISFWDLTSFILSHYSITLTADARHMVAFDLPAFEPRYQPEPIEGESPSSVHPRLTLVHAYYHFIKAGEDITGTEFCS